MPSRQCHTTPTDLWFTKFLPGARLLSDLPMAGIIILDPVTVGCRSPAQGRTAASLTRGAGFPLYTLQRRSDEIRCMLRSRRPCALFIASRLPRVQALRGGDAWT